MSTRTVLQSSVRSFGSVLDSPLLSRLQPRNPRAVPRPPATHAARMVEADEIRAASRRRRAARKLDQQRAVAGGVWTRCLYKVPGKERLCAQHRSVF